MNVKQIIGSIYLIIFIAVLGYNFNYFISDFKESMALLMLVALVILILVVFIRKILYET